MVTTAGNGRSEQDLDLTSAVSALETFATGLAADGYTLEVARTGPEELTVEIVPGFDACEDCLIPKGLFSEMISHRLRSEGVRFSELFLVYPTD